MNLGQIAGECATRAALQYLEQRGLLTLIAADKLVDPLRRHAKAALPLALDEAKQALDCGMKDVAQATFRASMALAGIAAAKEIEAETV